MPPGLASLCRQASWEEGQAQLQLVEVCAPPADTGVEPSPSPPPPPVDEPARAQQVAQLRAYLAGLQAGGASDAALVHLPTDFADLVERAAWSARSARAAERGWVGAAEAAAVLPPPAAGEPPTGDRGGASDPRLGAALAKVLQLDGALAVVDQRAAAVAAEGRKLEQQAEAWEEREASGGGGGGLAGAMARERRRLQLRERLEQALHGGGDAGSPGSSGSNGGGTVAGADKQADAAAGAGLTQQQEALVEALLGRPDSEGEAAAADPFAAAAAQLAAIDAQLAGLSAPAGGSGGSAAAGGACAAAPQDEREQAGSGGSGEAAEEGGEGPDLQAAAAGWQRARAEAQAAAERLRSVDAALRALRTGSAVAVV